MWRGVCEGVLAGVRLEGVSCGVLACPHRQRGIDAVCGAVCLWRCGPCQRLGVGVRAAACVRGSGDAKARRCGGCSQERCVSATAGRRIENSMIEMETCKKVQDAQHPKRICGCSRGCCAAFLLIDVLTLFWLDAMVAGVTLSWFQHDANQTNQTYHLINPSMQAQLVSLPSNIDVEADLGLSSSSSSEQTRGRSLQYVALVRVGYAVLATVVEEIGRQYVLPRAWVAYNGGIPDIGLGFSFAESMLKPTSTKLHSDEIYFIVRPRNDDFSDAQDVSGTCSTRGRIKFGLMNKASNRWKALTEFNTEGKKMRYLIEQTAQNSVTWVCLDLAELSNTVFQFGLSHTGWFGHKEHPYLLTALGARVGFPDLKTDKEYLFAWTKD